MSSQDRTPIGQGPTPKAAAIKKQINLSDQEK